MAGFEANEPTEPSSGDASRTGELGARGITGEVPRTPPRGFVLLITKGTRSHFARSLTRGNFSGGQVVTELSNLPPGERVKRYRELAQDARREAEQAKDEREGFLAVASAWERLADITEQIFAARLSDATETGTEDKLAAFKPPPAEPDES